MLLYDSLPRRHFGSFDINNSHPRTLPELNVIWNFKYKTDCVVVVDRLSTLARNFGHFKWHTAGADLWNLWNPGSAPVQRNDQKRSTDSFFGLVHITLEQFENAAFMIFTAIVHTY